MRGHDQTNGRGRLRAGVWLVLVANAIGTTRAEEPAPPSATAPASIGSIELAAQRIRYWDDEGRHWALLEGRAAVLQEGRGLRADAVLVQFGPDAQGSSGTWLLAHAEGQVRPTDGGGQAARRLRMEFRTPDRVNLQTYDPKGPTRLNGPPANHPLPRRAFPEVFAKADQAALARASREQEPPAAEPTADSSGKVPLPILATPPPSSAEDPGVTLGAPIAETEQEPDPSATRAPVVVDPAVTRASTEAPVPVDPALTKVQFDGEGFADGPMLSIPADQPDAEPADDDEMIVFPDDVGPTDAVPLPESDVPDPAPLPPANVNPNDVVEVPAVVLPGTQRAWNVYPRNGGNLAIETRQASDGTTVSVIRGGVNIVSQDERNGLLDLSSDNAVIWSERNPDGGIGAPGGGVGGVQDSRKRLEVYLDGNVLLMQDRKKIAGQGDVTMLKADRLYMDMRTERKIGHNAEFLVFAPGMLAPVRIAAPEINQYTPQILNDKGQVVFGASKISAERTMTTGSRFPEPGYSFTSRSIDVTQKVSPLVEPNSGRTIGNPNDPNAPKDRIWTIDARQNFYYTGNVPIFYWPRVVVDSDDLDPPIRNLGYRYGTYFGHQVLVDWNGFKLFNPIFPRLKKPAFIDGWNVDTDYLSLRGPAIGSEIGWFGRDVVGNLTDPYNRTRARRNVDQPYFGYLDFWGILDHGIDVLGPGPAVVTYGPPGFGKLGFQRTAVPPPPDHLLRGRVVARHFQSLLGEDARDDQDLRFQVEFGYESDRHFLEEYYKRLFDSGLDQETLVYGVRQMQNRAFTIHAEGVMQNWYTETQWLPKLEYYRLGDALLGGLFSHSQDSGVDWANTQTAVEVNNPNIFTFIPLDPVSNTSGPFKTGRLWTSHELQMPINLGVLRIVPYGQGQLIGWNNQLGGELLGRAWGAAGARANLMAWGRFPDVENDTLNLHGLAHKINLTADYRTAYSNVSLNRIGVQDDLDDNTYEFTRRYFAMTNYVGSLLPPQYDPRLLTLRRTVSPIAGTTDIQDTIQTVNFDIDQRLQTKRGPEGKRRVIDWMVLNLHSTYFPYARRDNFGKPFGQNRYNYEWYLGDRTSFQSQGWFEFWEIDGRPLLNGNPRHSNDPFDLSVITAGISVNRPPRGSVYMGYSVINTGPIATSALISSYSYWLSPKWYSQYALVYDFGNAILLGAQATVTRIGADFLTSMGLSFDPQRSNTTFAVEIVPRISPNMRLGSGGSLNRFDSRFAPTE